jgi:hypothetical protein
MMHRCSPRKVLVLGFTSAKQLQGLNIILKVGLSMVQRVNWYTPPGL